MRIQGVFITGTGTGVGKTVVAACCARAWNGRYWKPVQTGLAEDEGDTAMVAQLANLSFPRLLPSRHAFQAPLAPWLAAKREGGTLALEDFSLPPPDHEHPLVVEGAGGVLVPVTATALMADMMRWLDLPVIVVAGTGLGTINHTLLTLEALRIRHIPIAGVILNGCPDAENRAAIIHFGAVRIIAELPMVSSLNAATIAHWATDLIPPLDTVFS